jgi:hypothetical protein
MQRMGSCREDGGRMGSEDGVKRMERMERMGSGLTCNMSRGVPMEFR